MNKRPEVMSLRDAAYFIKQPESKLLSFYEKGELPGVELGDTYCFKSEDILKLNNEIEKKMRSPRSGMEVHLRDILKPEYIIFKDSSNKEDILNSLIKVIGKLPESGEIEDLRSGIFNREELMSTGMGLGIAIPHVRLSSIRNINMAAAVVKDGVKDYETLDQTPVHLVFMITARPDQHSEHLKVVSQLSFKLKDQDVREALLSVKDGREFLKIMNFRR
jgi:PTS system nitrogen regulatory IIA component